MRKKELLEKLRDREATIRAIYHVNENLRGEMLRLVAKNVLLAEKAAKYDQLRAVMLGEE